MGDKVLTISIAAYNVEDYISQGLDSLLVDRDTMGKMEVLVIDDGSRDRTADIAEEYAKKYPNSFRLISKENGGWGSTVNVGIRNANGKYFRLLDGDDWLITLNLADYVKFLSEVDSDIVLTPYQKMIEKDGSIRAFDHHSVDCNTVLRVSALTDDTLQDIHLAELTVKTEILQKNNVTISEHTFYTDNEYVFFATLYSLSVMKYAKSNYVIGLGGRSKA